jgi:hypothetical protein
MNLINHVSAESPTTGQMNLINHVSAESPTTGRMNLINHVSAKSPTTGRMISSEVILNQQRYWHSHNKEDIDKYFVRTQSVLRTLNCSTEPVRFLNSTTRPTRFGVFHLTTRDIVYDVICKWYNAPIGCLLHFNL